MFRAQFFLLDVNESRFFTAVVNLGGDLERFYLVKKDMG